MGLVETGRMSEPANVLALEPRRVNVGHPRTTYLLQALLHPVTSVAVVAGVSFGIFLGSALLVMAVVVGALGASWVLSGHTGFQRTIQEYLVDRQRRQHRERREDQLDRAGVHRGTLLELTQLVDEIERADDGWTGQRFELEDLIDQYVDLAAAHERCLRALRQTDRSELVRNLKDHRMRPAAHHTRVCELLERRIRCWDDCRARADHLEAEIAAIVELIRLLAQRASCPELPIPQDPVAPRLRDLDEDEAAVRELAG
jgi:hypothetical protein